MKKKSHLYTRNLSCGNNTQRHLLVWSWVLNKRVCICWCFWPRIKPTNQYNNIHMHRANERFDLNWRREKNVLKQMMKKERERKKDEKKKLTCLHRIVLLDCLLPACLTACLNHLRYIFRTNTIVQFQWKMIRMPMQPIELPSTITIKVFEHFI